MTSVRACALLLVLGTSAAAQDAFPVEPLKPDSASDARIAALVEALRGIDAPHDGITCWSGGGVAFDALENAAPPAFRELVRLGPAAIPALLDHLTDERRTRLSFRKNPEAAIGGMFLLPEIPAGNSEEHARIRRALGVAAIKDGPHGLRLPDHRITDYTVTVGDCCFAILGQIVNRSYEAVRYQPTSIAIISSPTQEPRIAKVLRGRWGRADPRRLLAESLLDDFRLRREGAAERLLFYFPSESGAMVAKRIARQFNDDYPLRGDSQVSLLQEAMRTGHPLVRAEWIRLLDPMRTKETQLAALKATPAGPDDEAREAIRLVLGTSTDPEILLAALRILPGERSEGLQARLERCLARVQTRDRQATLHALTAMVLLDDERSVEILRCHMERVAPLGSANVVYALGENPRSRVAFALLPLVLDQKSQVSWPGPRWKEPDTRLCDWAAHLVTKGRPDLAFDRDAPVEERDRQIAAMRAALAK